MDFLSNECKISRAIDSCFEKKTLTKIIAKWVRECSTKFSSWATGTRISEF